MQRSSILDKQHEQLCAGGAKGKRSEEDEVPTELSEKKNRNQNSI